MLIKGSAPRLINTEFYNITGKKIELPKGYQKLTGREFEVRKTGFFYQFAEKGWPFVRMVAVILVMLGLTVYLSFNFLYRPLQALIYYNQGIDLIEQDEYDQGVSLFNKAYFGWSLGKLTIEGWPSKSRFLEYADAFLDRRAYPDAAHMYEGLLGEYPDYIKGYHEYGLFLTNITGEYAKAAEILSSGLGRDLYNYDLMLALGDNYMLWSEEDPDKLEDARFQYATALSRYDGNDEIMLRMLRYFLRVQDDGNISILSNIYSKKAGIRGDTAFISLTLSDLAGYYIDRNQVSEAKDLLFKAEEIDTTVPDVHYQLARYFRRTYNMDQEKKALQKALFYMDQTQPLNRSRIFKKIGIYRRRGEIGYEEGLYDEAEEEFVAGIRLLEDSQVRGLIGTNPEIGELYADMGNLHYEIYDDLSGALNYFNLAEKNQYHTGDIAYRKGFIYYDQQQYNQAVLEFESALKNLSDTRNARFALANTLVYRQNLFGARNQYMEILRDLKQEESSLPYLAPEDILEHRSLVNHFIQVYNNLAYVDYSLSERGSDPAKQSQALLSLTRAADYADRIDRDPDTQVRTRPEDSLVFQNTMAMIKPLPGTDVFMFDEIPRTPDELLSK
jgi:tetratricopeptide (TPR) repeat protein